MKISEFIKELEEIKEREGDLRVTVFDEYTANEGWDYNYEDLWTNACICVELVKDEDEDDEEEKDQEESNENENQEEPEKVVCIR